jgi:hypothetical protein
MKKIWIICLFLCSAWGIAMAQSSKVVKVVRTETFTQKNTNNEFDLRAVGKVIVRECQGDVIRCEVRITGYGESEAQAAERTQNIVATSIAGSTPRVVVEMLRGLYSPKKCEVVTTVYVPATVACEVNDNSNMLDLLKRAAKKVFSR